MVECAGTRAKIIMKMNKMNRLLSTHPLGVLYTLFALTRVALYGFWPVNREFLYSCTQSLDTPPRS